MLTEHSTKRRQPSWIQPYSTSNVGKREEKGKVETGGPGYSLSADELHCLCSY
jgi:hypothetical protein